MRFLSLRDFYLGPRWWFTLSSGEDVTACMHKRGSLRRARRRAGPRASLIAICKSRGPPEPSFHSRFSRRIEGGDPSPARISIVRTMCNVTERENEQSGGMNEWMNTGWIPVRLRRKRRSSGLVWNPRSVLLEDIESVYLSKMLANTWYAFYIKQARGCRRERRSESSRIRLRSDRALCVPRRKCTTTILRTTLLFS